MKKQILAAAVGAALVAGTGTALAAPFNSFDPRSMGMGGAGAAVGNTATAPFFNPSLLAVTKEDDDFAMELPIIGGRVYDPDKFVDSINQFQENRAIIDVNQGFVLGTSIGNAESALDALASVQRGNYAPGLAGDAEYMNAMRAAAAPVAAALGTTNANGSGTVAGDTLALSEGLVTISDKALGGELGAATVIGIPSKKFGAALVMSSWAAGGAVIRYHEDDRGILPAISSDVVAFGDQLNAMATCDTPAACEAAASPNTDWQTFEVNSAGVVKVKFDPAKDLKSSVDARIINLSEVGLSFAREVTVGGTSFALGITPKYVQAITFDYVGDVNNAKQSEFNGNDYMNQTSNFNLDIGASKDFQNGWRGGVVVKNLIAQEYVFMSPDDTGTKVKTGTMKLSPQARAGVSYQNSWFTGALDVDLTENDPVGFEQKSRYAALGAEFNAFDWAQLRLGYRADLVTTDRSVASLGLGLSPFGVHFDLALATNGSNEIGGAMQLGFRF